MIRQNLGLIVLSLLLMAFLGGAIVHKDALRAKIDEAQAQGQDFSFETDVAGHLGFDKSLAAKVLRVPAEKAPDGRSHDFNLVLREGRPFRIVLWTSRRSSRGETSEAFAAETDGRIRRAIVESSAYNALGSLVPGTVADLKIHSSAVTTAYQRELDFWLNGNGKGKGPH
jgi:hypothetical protein